MSQPGKRGQGWPLLGGAFALAVLCLLVGLLIDTEQWSRWFAHPHRQPVPETTHQGAALWRIMLIIVAPAIVIVPLILVRRCRSPEPGLSRRVAMSSRDRWALLGLVALAFALGAMRLDESLWYDEIVALGSFAIHGPGAIVANYYDPANHILHTLVSWLSLAVLERAIGLHLALRLPAVLASLAAVVACSGLARIVCGPRVAMLAALLAAVLPVFVLEGVEARGYSMMMLFSALSNWALLAAWRDDRPAQWIGYALVSALGVWAHPMGAFVPLGHVSWMAWIAIRDQAAHRFINFAIASSFSAILTVTLYSPALPDIIQLRSIIHASSGEQPTLLGSEGWHALLQFGGSWTWWAALPGFVLLPVGFAVAGHINIENANTISKRDETPVSQIISKRDAMAMAWLGLPLFIVAVVVSGAWCYARFMLFAMPAAALTIAIGIDALWRRRPWLGWCCIAVTCIVSLADLATLPPKQPLRDAANFIRDRIEPRERVLVIGLTHPVMDIYSKDLHLIYTEPFGADLKHHLSFAPRTAQPRWIILYYPESVDDETVRLLREYGYEQQARFDGWADWGNGDVIVLRASGN